jgi:hypothetical protein
MSGVTLKEVADSTIPTPSSGKATIFLDDDGAPKYKDDTGTVIALAGAAGAGVPTGGTAGQVIRKDSGTDYDTSWVTVAAGAEIIIDGGGAEIGTGMAGWVEVPFACTIVAARALADQTGDIEVAIGKETYANHDPVSPTVISASAPVEISTDIKSQDTTLTGWTTSVAAGDIIYFDVVAVTDIERCTVSLTLNRTI